MRLWTSWNQAAYPRLKNPERWSPVFLRVPSCPLWFKVLSFAINRSRAITGSPDPFYLCSSAVGFSI